MRCDFISIFTLCMTLAKCLGDDCPRKQCDEGTVCHSLVDDEWKPVYKCLSTMMISRDQCPYYNNFAGQLDTRSCNMSNCPNSTYYSNEGSKYEACMNKPASDYVTPSPTTSERATVTDDHFTPNTTITLTYKYDVLIRSTSATTVTLKHKADSPEPSSYLEHSKNLHMFFIGAAIVCIIVFVSALICRKRILQLCSCNIVGQRYPEDNTDDLMSTTEDP